MRRWSEDPRWRAMQGAKRRPPEPRPAPALPTPPDRPDLSRALDRSLPLEVRRRAYVAAIEAAYGAGWHVHPGKPGHHHPGPRFHEHRPDGTLR